MEVNTVDVSKADIVSQVNRALESDGYVIAELEDQKPWGAFFRLENSNAAEFIKQYFPGLAIEEARLGLDDAELSPKILIVSPGQRLSWQYHNRRAERWAFLTDGAYNKSMSDEPGDTVVAAAGDVVQFAQGERHRLVGTEHGYTLVAEIWQHTDIDHPSDESDITRLSDDYGR